MLNLDESLREMVKEHAQLKTSNNWSYKIWITAANHYSLTSLWDGHESKSGWEVTSIQIKRKGTGVLIISKAEKEGKTPLIAFTSGKSFGNALTNLREDIRCGRLNWKEQRPWES